MDKYTMLMYARHGVKSLVTHTCNSPIMILHDIVYIRVANCVHHQLHYKLVVTCQQIMHIPCTCWLWQCVIVYWNLAGIPCVVQYSPNIYIISFSVHCICWNPLLQLHMCRICLLASYVQSSTWVVFRNYTKHSATSPTTVYADTVSPM